MGRNQEFICGTCGMVTDSPRFTRECPAVHGGPHSWSAIPMAANQEVHNNTPINLNMEFSWFFGVLGAVAITVLAYTGGFRDFNSGFFFGLFIVGLISGYVLKFILKFVLGCAIFGGFFWVLDYAGIIKLDEKKPNNPPKVLRVNK
jgi:hypothetical protein